MRSRRERLLSGAAVAFTVALTFGVIYLHRLPSQRFSQAHSSQQTKSRVPQDYVDPATCEICHAQIAKTFHLTGMGRSFSKLRGDKPFDGFKNHNRLYHETSNRYYTMTDRGAKFYERRHQIGFDGKETNVIECQADYEIGSGNHARTFVHRKPDGELLEMPVSWYSERGGYWAMSPGYDRSAHLDFRRPVVEGCMSCHNAYPRSDLSGDALPEGIDCQRCHGPGKAHVDAMKAGDVDAGRRAIVNPAKLDRDRQLEVCMQCHLETTSSPLPFQIRRYEHAVNSFTPGNDLGDYFIYFDHASGNSRDDKFEIAGAAYRLRKSACFQRSQMTCLTCHDPHDIPHGPAAVQHYVSVCKNCHQDVHKNGVPRVQKARSGTCMDCHMPKRRAEDAVHVVMTDHYIQPRLPDRDLLAPRREAENFEHGVYRGEVELYYPPKLPPTPENILYLALAQVQQGSNLDGGITRLQAAIEKYKPERPEFYYELARAYSKTSDYEADIHWCNEALRHDANFMPALKELGAASTSSGKLLQASEALEKVISFAPQDGTALADLGNVYLLQDRADDARKVLAQALTINPDLPQANNTMGLAALKKGETAEAEKYFRSAIRIQPDLAEAQNNLGNLLAERRAYAEAGYHFEQAIRSNPKYVEAHHSYGMVLALRHSYSKAITELQTAINLSPGLTQAHVDLADVFEETGHPDEAVREYEIGIQGNPAEYDAHLALGEILARQRRTSEARLHLENALHSTDPKTRQAAMNLLQSLQK
ncbi:MAG TPA: tetratricopeptide repeat protein [Terriglobales bacterium]